METSTHSTNQSPPPNSTPDLGKDPDKKKHFLSEIASRLIAGFTGLVKESEQPSIHTTLEKFKREIELYKKAPSSYKMVWHNMRRLLITLSDAYIAEDFPSNDLLQTSETVLRKTKNDVRFAELHDELTLINRYVQADNNPNVEEFFTLLEAFYDKNMQHTDTDDEPLAKASLF